MNRKEFINALTRIDTVITECTPCAPYTDWGQVEYRLQEANYCGLETNGRGTDSHRSLMATVGEFRCKMNVGSIPEILKLVKTEWPEKVTVNNFKTKYKPYTLGVTFGKNTAAEWHMDEKRHFDFAISLGSKEEIQEYAQPFRDNLQQAVEHKLSAGIALWTPHVEAWNKILKIADDSHFAEWVEEYKERERQRLAKEADDAITAAAEENEEIKKLLGKIRERGGYAWNWYDGIMEAREVWDVFAAFGKKPKCVPDSFDLMYCAYKTYKSEVTGTVEAQKLSVQRRIETEEINRQKWMKKDGVTLRSLSHKQDMLERESSRRLIMNKQQLIWLQEYDEVIKELIEHLKTRK